MFNLGKVKKLEKEIEGLKRTIKFKDEKLDKRENLIQEKNEEISMLRHNELILLKNAEELRNRIVDLENNIEFLYNNLSAQKRKQIRPAGLEKGEKSE